MIRAESRVALVTGGATGIGVAITARLVADGFDVYVVQRTAADAAAGRQALAASVDEDRVEVAAHDLAGAAGCADAVAGCVARFGGPQVLVNNAGITGPAALTPIDDCDDERIDAIIDTNLKAPIRLAREALTHLEASSGVIVNIGSIAGTNAQAEACVYVASKAGLVGLTRALACDLAPRGIRVVCVAPGAITTPASSDADFVAERVDAPLAKNIPLGRLGSAQEVADVVAWAASDQASYVTGSTIVVDGALAAY